MAFFLILASCTRSDVAVGGTPITEKTITIAVIDSGFHYRGLGTDAKLCKYGHKDFTIDRQFSTLPTVDKVPLDLNAHGTNIVGLIEKELKDLKTPYCFVIIKYYSDQQTGHQNLVASTKAIQYATNIKAKYLNYSGGGPEFDEYENIAVTNYILSGGKFVAAAGNERQNIDLPENYYYPAKYNKKIVIVGNRANFVEKPNQSNFGTSVTRWENGMNQVGYEIEMSGTSQATAVATGKLIMEATRGN